MKPSDEMKERAEIADEMMRNGTPWEQAGDRARIRWDELRKEARKPK